MLQASQKLAVIADDLTGANDTGVQFSKHGISTIVVFQLDALESAAEKADVVVVNTDSRLCAPRSAYYWVRLAAEALKKMGISRIYKKIDSAFRGNIGAELDGAMDAFGAPSFNYNGSSVITSDEALDFREVPESLLVVGGGVIGCELAFIFAGLGSKVTVVDIMPTVLPMEDPDVSSAILASLKKHGIDVMCGVKIESITEGDREVTALLDSGRQLVAEKALLSVGRRANSEGIGLEELGVELNKRGEIAVDEDMETNVRGIYAIGDVVGNIMLAHVASHEGIVAAHNVAGDKKSMDYNAVPSAIFTRPEVASVGLNEVQAKEQGFDVRIGKFPFMASGKALAMGRTEGFVKVIADAESDVILGVHIVGPGATDLIPEPTVAVRTQMTVHEFTNTIHAHPTLAEALVEAAQAVHGMSIHI